MITLQQLKKYTDSFASTGRMPILFLGHGSPMNAIEKNRFTQNWQQLGKHIPKPSAILSISAHWESQSSLITAMEMPKTIHDFYNFPTALYEMHYPAPGDPLLAKRIHTLNQHIALDHEWGLDHGTWAVICHIFPNADIPVLQLSLNQQLSPKAHFELAKELAILREQGVLIIGSGNIVHNLRRIDFYKPDSGFDWAETARESIVNLVESRDYDPLIRFREQGHDFKLAIPTPEHFLPLLYILGLQQPQDETLTFNDQSVMGSLAMTSFLMG